MYGCTRGRVEGAVGTRQRKKFRVCIFNVHAGKGKADVRMRGFGVIAREDERSIFCIMEFLLELVIIERNEV